MANNLPDVITFNTTDEHGDTMLVELEPGQEFEQHWGARDEEGYWYEHNKFFFDPETGELLRWTESGGRDCDGPLHRYSASRCPLDKLTAWEVWNDIENDKGEIVSVLSEDRFPEWERVESWQRDEFAERMGY